MDHYGFFRVEGNARPAGVFPFREVPLLVLIWITGSVLAQDGRSDSQSLSPGPGHGTASYSLGWHGEGTTGRFGDLSVALDAEVGLTERLAFAAPGTLTVLPVDSERLEALLFGGLADLGWRGDDSGQLLVLYTAGVTVRPVFAEGTWSVPISLRRDVLLDDGDNGPQAWLVGGVHPTVSFGQLTLSVGVSVRDPLEDGPLVLELGNLSSIAPPLVTFPISQPVAISLHGGATLEQGAVQPGGMAGMRFRW